MGRPKVPESERQRAAIACSACRRAKKRCSSATAPCVQCRRRGRSASCSLVFSATTPSSAAADSRALHRPRHGDETSPLSQHSPWPRPRMLQNLQGEKVFIGQAASLSFLQILRDIVAAHIGPSAFSHNERTENMLEVESPLSTKASLAAPQQSSPPMANPRLDNLSVDCMLYFGRMFAASVDGFLGLFAPSEIQGLLVASASLTRSPPDHGGLSEEPCYRNPYKRATVHLIVAIGAQCTSPSAAADVGLSFLRRAQRVLTSPEGILEDPSVDMVRAFLLLAWYMLGSCRRNAAYMYIGIAARAAAALGLHSREAYAEVDRSRKQLRLRIWASLCILDMAVSAILGRPAATASLRADVEPVLASMAVDATAAAGHSASSSVVAQGRVADTHTVTLLAAYGILSIISRIVDGLYGRKAIPIAVVESYLGEIDAWKLAHGRALKLAKPSAALDAQDADPQRRRDTGAIGNIHISCLYYFAVTLVTRPLLVRIHTTGGDHQGPNGMGSMAQACVDAAIYLVQTCVDAQDAGLLLGNMCIMKALVFIAGLILGLQSFAHQRIDAEVETAFAGARKNLSFLAVQSPQAAHYAEILGLLDTAVEKQRAMRKSATGHNRYVSRLFRLDDDDEKIASNANIIGIIAGNDTDGHGNPPGPKTTAYSSSEEGSNEASGRANTSRGAGIRVSLGEGRSKDGLALFDWDHLDITQWDDFYQQGLEDELSALDPDPT